MYDFTSLKKNGQDLPQEEEEEVDGIRKIYTRRGRRIPSALSTYKLEKFENTMR